MCIRDSFYVAGAFGKYVSKESAITIGMYPDMDRDHIINAGNSSLEGAQKLLLNRSLLTDIVQILEEMVYIQFAEVEDFLELMVAAQALPLSLIHISLRIPGAGRGICGASESGTCGK